ncbi:hypothetical protein BPNPMPFG_005040 [Mesorhizobium sp. AR07]|uniref:hypothetical protein n=1 Tax=Mesorhizobium sp. AR07 TaxID=2865838 RepID=UPI002160E74D|nr:hypothetical protein [Mesorhizobium sp. AR07]UVK43262.1 hypothetical protein BPNPMPFG_005040 [Mesorhizobium sp. AR07]
MSNAPVLAAAEGMPNLNRRTALAVTSAGIVSAITVLSTPAKAVSAEPAGVPAELLALIEAKHAAYTRFIVAIDRATPLEEEYLPKTAEMYVPLSIGGGQSRSLRYSELERVEDDLRDEIKRRYREQGQKLAALHKVAPDLAKQSTAALRKAEQSDLRTLKRLIEEERARRSAVGLEQALQERDAASDAERSSINAVCAYRCTIMEEHRIKAEFLLEFCTGKYGDLQSEDIDALLWSFLPVEALESAVKASEGGAA